MGDADQFPPSPPAPRPPSRLDGAPMVKGLLILNAAIFLVDLMLRPGGMLLTPGRAYNPSILGEWGEFSIETGFEQWQLWRLISFQFLHADIMHILFNMYAIYMFGPYAERFWKRRPFLVYYLLCGIGGALFYALLIYIPGVLPDSMVGTRLLGASAGVFGVLVAVAVIAPEGRVMLIFPPIPMKMRTFALLFIAIEVVIVVKNFSNAGGSAGHLGGALAGFLMMTVTPVRRALLALAPRPPRLPKS